MTLPNQLALKQSLSEVYLRLSKDISQGLQTQDHRKQESIRKISY